MARTTEKARRSTGPPSENRERRIAQHRREERERIAKLPIPANSFTTIAKWVLETLLDSSVPQTVVNSYEASIPVQGKYDKWRVVPRTTMNKLRGLLRDLDRYARNGDLDVAEVRVSSVHDTVSNDISLSRLQTRERAKENRNEEEERERR